MRLVEFVPPEGILHRLAATTASGVLIELSSPLARLNGLPAERVSALLSEREQLGSTGLGNEIAVPHARGDVARIVGVLALSERGVDFGAPDGKPVRIFVAFVSPPHGAAHLKALGAVGQTFSDAAFRQRLLQAKTAGDVYELLSALRDEGRPETR